MQRLVRLNYHNGYISWPRHGGIGVKCLSQGHNDTLPSSGRKPRADDLAIANLPYNPLSCTAASWDISVKCLSQEQRVGPIVGIELATLQLIFGALTD